MRLDSIRTERGILVFAVEEKTKTQGSRRLVPVHSKLKDQGLETLVADLRGRGETHLLPEWYSDGTDAKERSSGRAQTVSLYFARFIPRRFSVTYMPKVGVDHPKKSWHSLRHTFKTGLALAGVGRDLRDELCGHVDTSAGAGYVHDSSLVARRDAIEKLTLDGFGL
jgi:integrase